MDAASDLDTPSADMLVALHKELRQQGIRVILTRMATQVREILERADKTGEIGEADIHHSALDALADYFVSEAGTSDGRDVVRLGLLEVRDILRTRLSSATPESRAAFAAILDTLDREVARLEAAEPTGEHPPKDSARPLG